MLFFVPFGAIFSTVLSPFVYEEPVGRADLADRATELELLMARLMDARNSRLEAPRRFGKTSLLRAVLDRTEDQGAVAVEVNFLGCVTAVDVAERIERAYARQLDGPLRRWFSGLARTLQPTIQAAPAGVGVSAQLSAATPGLLDRLALPRRIFERTGRTCAIAFDEFQEVLRIDAALPGVIRSEIETHGPAAGYVFSGSHPGLMRDLFADRRHAFFAQATPVGLGPLPADELASFVDERFAAHRRDPGAALGPLLDAAEGHPQRAMLLAHHLFMAVQPDGAADEEDWASAEDAARREALGELVVLWESSSDVERRVLKVIAARDVPLHGAEAARRFGLAKSGSSQAALDRLVREGHVVEDGATRTGWRIVDPFLAHWLSAST